MTRNFTFAVSEPDEQLSAEYAFIMGIAKFFRENPDVPYVDIKWTNDDGTESKFGVPNPAIESIEQALNYAKTLSNRRNYLPSVQINCS